MAASPTVVNYDFSRLCHVEGQINNLQTLESVFRPVSCLQLADLFQNQRHRHQMDSADSRPPVRKHHTYFDSDFTLN